MKRILYGLGLSIFLIACATEKKESITLTNTSSRALTDKAVHITREELPDVPPGLNYPVLTTAQGDTIACQLDDLNGDGTWDELFLVIDLPANGSKELSLTWAETAPTYTTRTSIRFGKRDAKNLPVHPKTSDTLYADKIHARLGYQPYQTDGPSFENDKVGFRHYFDGRNVKDLFGKKVAYMSPEDVGIDSLGGVRDTYHVMADWGRDVLQANNSVGIGGINLMVGDSISRMGTISGDTVTNIEYSVFNIVTEGPVRSVFDITHHNWKPFDRTYQVKERVSIWPGMYAYQNTVSISGLSGDETLLVGIVNSNTPNAVTALDINDEFIALFTHDQQTYNREWWLGLAIILPKENYLGYGKAPDTGRFSTSFYGKLKIEENKPVTYYAVGGWELSDEGFKDPAYFENYIKQLAGELQAKVLVK